MGPHLVVIVEPCRQLLEHTVSIRPPMQKHIITLKTFDEAFSHAVGLGTVHGREAGHEAQRIGMSTVSCAVYALPLSVSHSMAWGAWMTDPKRRSTASTIRSRTCSPAIPDVVAVQVITSRSQVSSTKATRTVSPFQHGTSNTSEHQRRFERSVRTTPSCARCRPVPVWRASNRPVSFLSRYPRL